MKTRGLNNFLRGLYTREGSESKPPPNYLLVANNVRYEVFGSIFRRRGYDYWRTLTDGASASSFNDLPDAINRTGFGTKVQAIKHYVDVVGTEYIIVVTDGKIYVCTLTASAKIWTCLNPTGQMDLQNVSDHIGIVAYLDLVFFNDGTNILMYNSQAYSAAGWNVQKNKFTYFAGDRIMFRDFTDFSSDYHNHDITAVSTGSGTFGIAGDYRHHFKSGDTITVSGSTGNDGTYTLASDPTFATGVTTITVNETVSDATADGSIASQYRIRIQNIAANLEGKAIYDELATIGFIGAGDPIDTGSGEDETDLALGFCLRIGDDSGGYNYYVMESSKNERSNDECYIIKFNDSLIPTAYVTLNMDTNGDVLGFVQYNDGTDDYLYVWCKDGELNKIKCSDLSNTVINSGDITGMSGVTQHASAGGLKQYGLGITENDKLYLYTDTLPNKSDWWQPVYSERIYFGLNNDTNHDDVYDPNSRYGLPDATSLTQTIATDVRPWALPVNGTIVATWSQRFVSNYFKYWNSGGGYFEFYYNFYYKQDIAEVSNDLMIRPWSFREIDNSIFDNTGEKHGWEDSGFWESVKDRFQPEKNIGVFATETEDDIPVSGSSVKVWGQRQALTQSIEDEIQYEYLNEFQYDKDRDLPSDNTIYTDAGGSLQTDPQKAFYLYDTEYNPDILSSVTSSDYVLLVRLDLDGNMSSLNAVDYDGSHTWRYIFPLGKKTELRNLLPIVAKNDELHFGTSMIDGDSGQDEGYYIKMKNESSVIPSFNFEVGDCYTSDWKSLISGDSTLRWLLRQEDGGSYYYKANTSWNYVSGFGGGNDFVDMATYNSNLFFHIYRQVISGSAVGEIDRVQYLGTPSPPIVATDNFTGTPLFLKGTILRYYLSFEFYIDEGDDQTTMLSRPSDEVEIPDLGADPQAIKVVLTSIDLLNDFGIPIYDDNDIRAIRIYRSQKNPGETFFSEPTLIDKIERDVDGDLDYGSLPDGTYEDTTQTYTLVPFSEGTALRYPVKDIVVHKNRLILINKLNYENPNVLQYSDVDNAEALPASNIRPIQSGDGDSLVTAESMGDYLFLFKRTKIYAILGDVAAGQLIDIDLQKGTPYKNGVTSYEGAVYFINEFGVYIIQNGQVTSLTKDILTDIFDVNRHDSIDFSNMDENVFACVDTKTREIRFHIPMKVENVAQAQNNAVLIFDADYRNFKKFQYYDNIFVETQVRDVQTSEHLRIMSDYTGNIYELSISKNDNNKPIKYKIRTVAIDIDTKVIDKHFRVLEITGRYLHGLYVTYWIDGVRYDGRVSYRKTLNGKSSAMVPVVSGGVGREIIIEISGEAHNEVPFEIDEIFIGYDVLQGAFR